MTTPVAGFGLDRIGQISTLKARGSVVECEPQLTANMGTYELWIGSLRDPDENLLALMSEVPIPRA